MISGIVTVFEFTVFEVTVFELLSWRLSFDQFQKQWPEEIG